MLVIPAIDIKDGKVVRLVQGRKDKKVYSHDPVKTALHWVRQGAELLHIIDLDGAALGFPKNLAKVKEISQATGVPIQFGGGVRKIETIEELVTCGIARVILGTKAIEDKNFLKSAFKKFKEKIIVSIDAQEDELLIKGWQESSKNADLLTFACALEELGFKKIIYTDTSKDGTLKGPNLKNIKRLLKETKLKVIASGGISSLDDLIKLKFLEKQGLEGVIVGKALYEGKFTLAQALKLK